MGGGDGEWSLQRLEIFSCARANNERATHAPDFDMLVSKKEKKRER